MRKRFERFARSYAAHAIVGAVLSLLTLMMVFVVIAVFVKFLPVIIQPLFFITVILLPAVVGAVMYELRRWLAQEPFSLRSLFIYSLTSSTSFLVVVLFLFTLSRIEIMLQLHPAPEAWWIGFSGQWISIFLAGACVGVACLFIDNNLLVNNKREHP